MRKISAAVLAAAAFLAMAPIGAAWAGTVGVGPTGSLIVGSTVIPPSQMGAVAKTPAPGEVGTIALTVDQARAIAAYLKDKGGTVNGSVITATMTFADGTPGQISLDT